MRQKQPANILTSSVETYVLEENLAKSPPCKKKKKQLSRFKFCFWKLLLELIFVSIVREDGEWLVVNFLICSRVKSFYSQNLCRMDVANSNNIWTVLYRGPCTFLSWSQNLYLSFQLQQDISLCQVSSSAYLCIYPIFFWTVAGLPTWCCERRSIEGNKHLSHLKKFQNLEILS